MTKPGDGWVEIERPDLPKASGYQVFSCGDPKCGPHIVIDVNGAPAVEMIISQQGLRSFIKDLSDAVAFSSGIGDTKGNA